MATPPYTMRLQNRKDENDFIAFRISPRTENIDRSKVVNLGDGIADIICISGTSRLDVNSVTEESEKAALMKAIDYIIKSHPDYKMCSPMPD